MSVLMEPVGVEELARLRELSVVRDNLAHKVLSLDLEKITLLMAGRRVDEEHDALIHHIMTERGIHTSSRIDINPRTGEVVVQSGEATPPASSVPPKAEATAATG